MAIIYLISNDACSQVFENDDDQLDILQSNDINANNVLFINNNIIIVELSDKLDLNSCNSYIPITHV